MVKFKTKIVENKSHKQKSVTIPSWVFKQDLLKYNENSEYEVEITELPTQTVKPEEKTDKSDQ